MLSRVATSLYWMMRYLERAENVARIVQVHQQALLDLRRVDENHLSCHWLAILESTGDEGLYFQLEPRAHPERIAEFLVYSRDNRNSMISCITEAREIARKTRNELPCEMWEEINRVYLFITSTEGRRLWSAQPRQFLDMVLQSALTLHGIANDTIARGEGWLFMQIGQFLERADKTSRILDIRHRSIHGGESIASTTLEWGAILHSCCAWDAYRQTYSLQIYPHHVAELLLFSERFPRSVRFCLGQLVCALQQLPGSSGGAFSITAERLAGRLLAELQYGCIEEVIDTGLHQSIDRLQAQLNAIGDAVVAAASIHQGSPTEAGIQRQQEQQQQVRRQF